MAYKVPKIPPMQELVLGTNSKYSLDGGLCLDEQSSISLTQSPFGGLLNMCLDDGGVPKKRPGQTDLFNNLSASFGINDIALSQQITSTLPNLVSTPNLSIIDDNDPNIIYNGAWQIENSSNVYGGTGRYSSNTNDYIQYTFVGTGINFYCSRYTNKGIARIYIDGADKGTIDLYNATSQFKYKAYSITDLSYGMHTIKIVVTGTKNALSTGPQIYFDYFEVITNESWRLVTDKSNLIFLTSIDKIALLCEMDLTSFCTANYASVNADMKAKFYTILNNIIASSSGASGSGYDTYVYNYSTSAFELLTTFTTNHISSSNKVDLMLYPKYVSDGVTPCTMNISSYNFTLSFLKLGYGKVNGIYPNYKGKTIVAWGAGIYTQTGTNDMVLIYSGVTNSKAIFYVYNSMLYFFNGKEFLKYDGTTVSTITPYIPRHSYNCKPDGSNATIDESWNLIGTGFRRAFNGDGQAKDFTLPYKSLDATLVTAIVDGVAKVETTDFTVNRATGVVTFTTAPSLSGVLNPNNVEITAYKTFSGYKEQIINCTRVQEAYSVLFLTGNSNLPNQYWVGGITPGLDASYFPFNRIFNYTGTDKACTCFAMYQDTLLIFKENEFSRIEQVTSPTGIATFNRININSEIGCDCPDTIQLINDRPTWLTSYAGVQTLETLISGVKSCVPISINIQGDISRPGILQENINDLKSAVSFNFNGQYGICLPNGHCYEWEYLRGYTLNNPKSMKWYLWDNINASCFFVRDNTLMFGHRLRGQLCKFTDILNDFGSAINAIFSTKLYDLTDPAYEKYVPYCYLTTRAGSGSALTVKFIDDQDTTQSTEFIPVTETKSFNLDNVDLDNWVWDVQVYAPTIALSPILQSIRYLRIEISNNNINEDLSIVAISLPYQFTRRVL